jgi:DNA-binding cell septation regulator SpoVG
LIEITRVRIQLHEPRPRPDGRKDWRLKAFADVDLGDCFAFHGVRILTGDDGNLFIAFPSHRVEDHCPSDSCRERVALKDRYCRACGIPLPSDRGKPGPDGRIAYHSDVCHPITRAFREAVEDAVLEAYYDAVQERDLAQAARPDHPPLSARVRAGEAA